MSDYQELNPCSNRGCTWNIRYKICIVCGKNNKIENNIIYNNIL